MKNENINNIKILLANKTTEMLHGEKAALNSEKIAKETFTLNSSGSNLPSVKINKSILQKKITIIDLVILSKLENSKSEIRRLIKGNAIKLNNRNIINDNFIIENSLFNENYLKLSIGKKRHIKIELI
jgi:tyrosyl-tRNA synthetase